jgi:hypothetical protein
LISNLYLIVIKLIFNFSLMKRSIYLHLGYPKTGTTTLQRVYFNNAKKINFLGKPFKNLFLKDVIDSCCILSDKQFKNFLKKNIKKIEKILDDDVILISQESILKPSTFMIRPQGYDIQIAIKRLYKILNKFGNVRFYITIRKHTDIIYSLYNEKFLEWKFFNLNFENLRLFFLKKKLDKNNFILDSLKYFKLYSFLKKLNGEKNICLLFYEDFLKNKDTYLSKIDKFGKFSINNKIDKKLNVTEKKGFIGLIKKLYFHKLKNKINIFKIVIYIKYLLYLIKKIILIKLNYIPKKKFQDLDFEIKNYYKKDILKFPKHILKKMKLYKYL